MPPLRIRWRSKPWQFFSMSNVSCRIILLSFWFCLTIINKILTWLTPYAVVISTWLTPYAVVILSSLHNTLSYFLCVQEHGSLKFTFLEPIFGTKMSALKAFKDGSKSWCIFSHFTQLKHHDIVSGNRISERNATNFYEATVTNCQHNFSIFCFTVIRVTTF